MISHITPDMETNGGGRFLCAVGGCVGLQTRVDALFLASAMSTKRQVAKRFSLTDI